MDWPEFTAAQVQASIDAMDRFDLSGSISSAMAITRRVDAFINETAIQAGEGSGRPLRWGTFSIDVPKLFASPPACLRRPCREDSPAPRSVEARGPIRETSPTSASGEN